MGQPQPILLIIICLFKQTSLQFLQQIYVKSSHLVYDAGIQIPTFGTWVSFHNH